MSRLKTRLNLQQNPFLLPITSERINYGHCFIKAMLLQQTSGLHTKKSYNTSDFHLPPVFGGILSFVPTDGQEDINEPNSFGAFLCLKGIGEGTNSK